ncbi:PucR family transcriptional regulator [Leifsonia poae]|uniref:PucR family transcriptional regulator n=1 Tax=Leifsonia poae TaxID=110933 RepID=UPI001CBCBF1B|nr:helix-turn-helix domain-containing protein [Leifsonia poae]
MQGLMLKLVNVDAAGERALRVVSYFDQLSTNSPDLEAVVRATAVIADCTAGVELSGRGMLVRCSRDGEPLHGPRGQTSGVRILDGEEEGRVWLERESAARDLDEFIIERFALTVASVLRRRSATDLEATNGFADPALAQILISDRATEAERSRAAQLIGLQPSSTVQLIALEPDDGTPVEAVVRDLRAVWSRRLFAAQLSRRLALVVVVGAHPADLEAIDVPARLGAGPVVETLDAPRSWSAARETLRFAGAGIAWPRALDARSVGVLRLLGGIDAGTIAADDDVSAIARIAAETGGELALELLDAYLHSGSLREAARATNFHHSSLQSRIGRIGTQLDIDLASPAGRQRAQLALLLWRCSL